VHLVIAAPSARQLTWVRAVSTHGASSIDRWNSGSTLVMLTAFLLPLLPLLSLPSVAPPPGGALPSSTPHTVHDGYLAACSRIVSQASSLRLYDLLPAASAAAMIGAGAAFLRAVEVVWCASAGGRREAR
jgi:hypothetical protein